MKIAVLGAGGVGAYFGGRLAQAGAEVHLLARGAHLRALVERGLRVRSANGNLELRLPATDRIEDIGPVDYVLFCVKSLETETVAARMKPLLHEGTTVISLQNGATRRKSPDPLVRIASSEERHSSCRRSQSPERSSTSAR